MAKPIIPSGSGTLSIGVLAASVAIIMGIAGKSSDNAKPKERIVYIDDGAGAGQGSQNNGANNSGTGGAGNATQTGGAGNATQTGVAGNGEGEGANRQWRGYVDTDLEKLRAQLPNSAKHLAETFIGAGQKYNIDPLFLVSISHLETASPGKGGWSSSSFINKNNAMGISNISGPTRQSSASNSIYSQAASLAGAAGTAGNYNGANTVAQVGASYAPRDAPNDPHGTNGEWGNVVGQLYNGYVNKIRK